MILLQKLAEKIEARIKELRDEYDTLIDERKFDLADDREIARFAFQEVLSEIRKIEGTFLPKNVHEKTLTARTPLKCIYCKTEIFQMCNKCIAKEIKLDSEARREREKIEGASE